MVRSRGAALWIRLAVVSAVFSPAGPALAQGVELRSDPREEDLGKGQPAGVAKGSVDDVTITPGRASATVKVEVVTNTHPRDDRYPEEIEPCADFVFRGNPDFEAWRDLVRWHEEAHAEQIRRRVDERLRRIVDSYDERSGNYTLPLGKGRVVDGPANPVDRGANFRRKLTESLQEVVEEVEREDHENYRTKSWTGRFAEGSLEHEARQHACRQWMDKYGRKVLDKASAVRAPVENAAERLEAVGEALAAAKTAAREALAAATRALAAARACDLAKLRKELRAYRAARREAEARKAAAEEAASAAADALAEADRRMDELEDEMEKAALLDFPDHRELEKEIERLEKRRKAVDKELARGSRRIDKQLADAEARVREARAALERCAPQDGAEELDDLFDDLLGTAGPPGGRTPGGRTPGGRTPAPWAVESPRAAGAAVGVGAGYLDDWQDGLRSTFASTAVTLVGTGEDTTTVVPGDPDLDNRKFDYEWHLDGPLLQVPIGLPTESWGFYTSAIFEAAWAGVELDVLDLAEPELGNSLAGSGPMVGLWLDFVAPLGRRWFAGGGYRFRTLSGVDVDRFPRFEAPGLEVLRDETEVSRDAQEVYARFGVELPGRRLAPYAGLRARDTEVEVEDLLAFRSDVLGQETRLATRSRFENDVVEAFVGVDVHLGGSLFGRGELAFGETSTAWLKLTYLFGGRSTEVQELPPPPTGVEDGEMREGEEEEAPEVPEVPEEEVPVEEAPPAEQDPEEGCGCRRMKIEPTGRRKKDLDDPDLPEDEKVDPEVQFEKYVAEGLQRKLGPYIYPFPHQGEEYVDILMRMLITAELEEDSEPGRCAEGQIVQGTYTWGDPPKDYPVGAAELKRKKQRASADDPTAKPGDDVPFVECRYGGEAWCDDNFHEETPQGAGWYWKKYAADKDFIWWVDPPGMQDLKRSQLPFTAKFRFKAEVRGTEGRKSCACTWDVVIENLHFNDEGKAAVESFEIPEDSVECTNP